MSSLVGAIFGALVLALFIPIVRPLVLTFGSGELFMLAVLGLTFVAALSGGTPLKALLGAGIGLFPATVGMDPQTGIQRFTTSFLCGPRPLLTTRPPRFTAPVISGPKV